ncbi:hypothetical protein KUTeg_013010 [Tegillarca granosa]|uniref:Transmembrane protein 179 n=1 Tax=Tegillarca granosa TaxID=220873 RepID=A0ABQ9ESG0_TEGGR|nr:hypothetical protein KUTeg_013010 [Tegillarca granosa]
MGLGNILVLAQATCFLISFIVSFFLFVPLTVSVNDSDGHCLLYTTGKWLYSNETGRELADVKWGPDSACGFSVFMGVIVMFLSLFYVIWESIYLYKDTDSSWLDAFVTAILCLVGCLMLFASSLTLSVGYQKWCYLITRPESEIEQCEDGEFIQIKFKDYTLNTSNYYTMMNMAQVNYHIN